MNVWTDLPTNCLENLVLNEIVRMYPILILLHLTIRNLLTEPKMAMPMTQKLK